MKRLILAFVLAAGMTAVLAGGAASAPAVGPSEAAAPAAAKATKLPPLPAAVKARKRWIIGVKCDAPPFGYIDVRGNNQGFDVEIARWFARYAFGRANRVSFVCAPTPSREPLITSGRVDLVISTFTYTRDRDTRIDFSRAYYKATGRLLVRNDSPIRSLRDLPGKTVVTTSAAIYATWVRRCFPTANLIATDNLTNARLTFEQGRADTLMWDDTVLVGIAAADRNMKLTNDLFLEAPYGIGMRQGYRAMKRWVDSRLELMRKADRFLPILRNTVPARFVPAFSKNILRPNNRFGYVPADAPDPTTVCP